MRALITLWIVLGVAQARPRVAVIEAITPPDTPVRRAMDWTDGVRGALQRHLGATHTIMTRQNIESLLPPGTDLADCEGDCEVETGRNVGADLIVSVRIAADAVRVTILRTQDGQVVGQGREAIAGQVDAALQAATAVACSAIVTPPMAPAPQPVRTLVARPNRKVRFGYLRVESPHRAKIYWKGRTYGTTPVNLPITSDQPLEFTAKATGYPTGHFTVAPRSRGVVTVDLGAYEGRLALDDLPATAHVSIDGGPPTLARGFRLAPGVHRITVIDPCFAPTPVEARLVAGEPTRPDLTAVTTCPHVRLSANVPGATARWGGRDPLTLPATVLGSGGESIGVVIEAPDHHVIEKTLTVPATGGHSERFALTRRDFPVQIAVRNVFGEGCDDALRIDGEAVGHGQWSGRLTEGEHRVESDCGPGVRETIRVTPDTAPITLITDQQRFEVGMRSDPGRTTQLVLAGHHRNSTWPHMRIGFGIGLGASDVGGDAWFLATLDLNIGLPVMNWLEVTFRSTLGDGQTCSEGDCDVDYGGGAAGLRLQYGWLYSDLEYGVFVDNAAGDEQIHHGPGVAFGLAIPYTRNARRSRRRNK